MTDEAKTTGRCATCRHWSPEPVSETLRVRQCLRVMKLWDATEWDTNPESDYERIWTAEAAGVLAFANDGSSYAASLLTRPEFGCVMWEAADAK